MDGKKDLFNFNSTKFCAFMNWINNIILHMHFEKEWNTHIYHHYMYTQSHTDNIHAARKKNMIKFKF